MGKTLTAEESRNECVKAMGKLLGQQYAGLWQELAWVNAKWNEYGELFGSKPTRVELLNKAAPVFFRITQDTLWEAVLLHICRLTDPPTSAGKATLTVRRLPELVDPKIKGKVTASVKKATEKSSFCRDWRNRHIAHTDLALALKEGAKPLEPASRQGVRDALAALADVLNDVSRHYQSAESVFDHLPLGGGAASLLYIIDDGLKVAQKRFARLSRGDLRSEDWANRAL